jgi:hypothetical protein
VGCFAGRQQCCAEFNLNFFTVIEDGEEEKPISTDSKLDEWNLIVTVNTHVLRNLLIKKSGEDMLCKMDH